MSDRRRAISLWAPSRPVVPRNFIPSVEKGVLEYLNNGPLGFPVVDVAVALIDGSFHSVDSSDAAFQTAARIAMRPE